MSLVDKKLENDFKDFDVDRKSLAVCLFQIEENIIMGQIIRHGKINDKCVFKIKRLDKEKENPEKKYIFLYADGLKYLQLTSNCTVKKTKDKKECKNKKFPNGSLVDLKVDNYDFNEDKNLQNKSGIVTSNNNYRGFDCSLVKLFENFSNEVNSKHWFPDYFLREKSSLDFIVPEFKYPVFRLMDYGIFDYNRNISSIFFLLFCHIEYFEFILEIGKDSEIRILKDIKNSIRFGAISEKCQYQYFQKLFSGNVENWLNYFFDLVIENNYFYSIIDHETLKPKREHIIDLKNSFQTDWITTLKNENIIFQYPPRFLILKMKNCRDLKFPSSLDIGELMLNKKCKECEESDETQICKECSKTSSELIFYCMDHLKTCTHEKNKDEIKHITSGKWNFKMEFSGALYYKNDKVTSVITPLNQFLDDIVIVNHEQKKLDIGKDMKFNNLTDDCIVIYSNLQLMYYTNYVEIFENL